MVHNQVQDLLDVIHVLQEVHWYQQLMLMLFFMQLLHLVLLQILQFLLLHVQQDMVQMDKLLLLVFFVALFYNQLMELLLLEVLILPLVLDHQLQLLYKILVIIR